MRRTVWMVLIMCLVIPGLLLTTSCQKKVKPITDTDVKTDQPTKETTQPVKDTGETDAERQARLERERQERLARERAERERLAREMQAAKERFEVSDIYFAFDSSVLSSEAQTTLNEKAEFMNSYSNASVIIEGHCDPRGTNEYNLALGDRRAESAKAYLINLGVSASRLTTISYGEERSRQVLDEEIMKKERRAHFVVE